MAQYTVVKSCPLHVIVTGDWGSSCRRHRTHGNDRAAPCLDLARPLWSLVFARGHFFALGWLGRYVLSEGRRVVCARWLAGWYIING